MVEPQDKDLETLEIDLTFSEVSANVDGIKHEDPLWSEEADGDLQIEGSDTLTSGEDDLVLDGGEGHDFYVYKPGDNPLTIDDVSGINILILKEIYATEISVKRGDGGYLKVFYEGKPIVSMKGIAYLQTENGVAPVEDWMLF